MREPQIHSPPLSHFFIGSLLPPLPEENNPRGRFHLDPAGLSLVRDRILTNLTQFDLPLGVSP
jgi:hypothetical protein